MAKQNKCARNQGFSSRLGYDKCFIDEDIERSVGPLLYTMDPNRINNCNACLSVFGPRGGKNGYGVSTAVGHTTAPAQDLVDVDSILSNRNVIASKCKDGNVNTIDVSKFQLQNANQCNDFLDPLSTHLSNPPGTYRGMGVNRFYDLHTQPQANIFWDFSINTSLEARDNYAEKIPRPFPQDLALPIEKRGAVKSVQCFVTTDATPYTGIYKSNANSGSYNYDPRNRGIFNDGLHSVKPY